MTPWWMTASTRPSSAMTLMYLNRAKSNTSERLERTSRKSAAPALRASPGKIVGCGPGEVGVEILHEVGKSTLDAQLVERVHHRLVALVLGLERHRWLLRVTSLMFAVSRRSFRRQPRECGRSQRTPCRRRGKRSRGRSPPVSRIAAAM